MPLLNWKTLILYSILSLSILASCTGNSGSIFSGNPGGKPGDTDAVYGRNQKAFYNTSSPNSVNVVILSGDGLSPGQSAILIQIVSGIASSPILIPASALQLSADGTILTVQGQPGIFEYSAVSVASVLNGAAIAPGATVDTYCNGFSEGAFTEFRVVSVNGAFSFIAVGAGQSSSVGSGDVISKVIATNVTAYQQPGFGSMQINNTQPSVADANFFKASFNLIVSSPWQNVSMYCHLNNVSTNPALSYQSGNYKDEVLADLPVAYWRLGEAATSGTTHASTGQLAMDSSGNGFSGTYLGMGAANVNLGIPGALFGALDTAAQLGNALGYINAGVIAPANFEYNQSFSLEAWIRTTFTGINKYIVAHRQNSGNYPGYIFSVCETCANPHVISMTLEHGFYVGPSVGFHYLEVSGATTVNDGKWHHVVATYNGNGFASGVHLYVDGNLETPTVDQDALGNNSIQSNDPVTIGSNGDLGSGVFEGFIDEAAIYSSSLTSDRISTHYSIGALGH